MDGRLTIAIEGPSDPSDLRTPYLVTVRCPHGCTRLRWRRTCGNGCHQGTAARAERCKRVYPDPAALEHLGVLGHGQRVGCGCDEPYWMTEGPEHLRVEHQACGIQVEERMVSIWDRAAMQATLGDETWWGLVC